MEKYAYSFGVNCFDFIIFRKKYVRFFRETIEL